ncbi:hypothetical protein IX315_000970 [Porphyromonas levii]|nr:hypothetical protein [Porphyromonas levii]
MVDNIFLHGKCANRLTNLDAYRALTKGLDTLEMYFVYSAIVLIVASSTLSIGLDRCIYGVALYASKNNFSLLIYLFSFNFKKHIVVLIKVKKVIKLT